MPIDPKRIVSDGYDRIADRYLAWSALRPSAARSRALELADRLIPAGAEVLELGCGAGRPMTATLARGRHLTGVDISAEQIRRARRNVPGGDVSRRTSRPSTSGRRASTRSSRSTR